MGTYISITRIAVILGVSLVILGLFGPWYSFEKCDRVEGRCYRIDMSPFIFKAEIYDFYNPHQDPIDQKLYYLKNLDGILIGVICLFGNFLSLYSRIKKRFKHVLYAGCIVIASVLSFFIVLPVGATGFPRVSMCWGIYVTITGAALITVSSIIDMFSSKPS